MSVCYVSCFYDLGRENWDYFKRSFDEYLDSFQPYIDLFSRENTKNCEMIVFMDTRRIEKFNQRLNHNTKITVVEINEEFMNTLHIWNTLPKEREIMNSYSFKNLIPHRLIFPEHTIPEYTIINHSKIDLVNYVIDNNISHCQYFTWTDFGYFKSSTSIPNDFLDINKLDLNRINYTLISPIDENDNDIIYTLKFAPERIGGFFFFGRKDKMKEYQTLYHQVLKYYQDELSICDDDQAVSLACYFRNPDLFKLHCLYGWHRALTYFQI